MDFNLPTYSMTHMTDPKGESINSRDVAGVTSAMEAGISVHVWSLHEIVSLNNLIAGRFAAWTSSFAGVHFSSFNMS